jgi:glutamine amidotransferase
MMPKVCILDYGSGNVRSVYNLLATIVADVEITNAPGAIEGASHLILPGVGAFGASMTKIRNRIPIDVVEREVRNGKPFLGICVGMQVLAEKGFEFGEHDGLGWIPGVVDKLESAPNPLPHIGWNSVDFKGSWSPLLESFDTHQDFYFVHSYVFRPRDAGAVVASTEYGETFCSILGRDNVFGVQFHPEKSQKAGRILVQNFLKQS